MSFPRYPKYKASGVEWLGDVPEEWGVYKLQLLAKKQRYSFVDGPFGSDLKNEEYTLSGVPLIQLNNINEGAHLLNDTKFVTEEKANQLAKHNAFPGDVVLAKMAEPVARAALVLNCFERYVIVADCVRLSVEGTFADPSFAVYAINSPYFRSHAVGQSSGTTRLRINLGALKKLPLTLPPLPEQTAIAEFLDRETAKIDGLVAEQRRLMELLKEKRQAVISHAVTKGLNPHAPMKPSGIEWLGDVPAGWALKRLQNVCNFQSGKAHEPFICDDGIYICVTSRFVSTQGMKCKMCSENITPAKLNDTLIVMSDLPNGRALAKAYFVSDERAYAVNQRVCILRPFSVVPKYLYYLLDRNPEFLQHDDGINQTHLANSEFLKPQFPFPPYDEQEVIVEFLDTEIAKFDTLTAEAQRAIDLLQERRTALISAAVTGQIDVRQHPKN